MPTESANNIKKGGGGVDMGTCISREGYPPV